MKKFNLKAGVNGLMLTTIIFMIAITGCNRNDYLLNENTQGNSNLNEADFRKPMVPANLQVPAGNHLYYHVYASGVQIYRCNGTGWVFVAPEATLYADAGFHSEVGTHYAGPRWESNSGSLVRGAVDSIAPSPDPDAIPWLLLRSVTNSGSGIYDITSFIQRVNTVGGKAPVTGCDSSNIGAEVRIPYTAEYYFYKAE